MNGYIFFTTNYGIAISCIHISNFSWNLLICIHSIYYNHCSQKIDWTTQPWDCTYCNRSQKAAVECKILQDTYVFTKMALLTTTKNNCFVRDSVLKNFCYSLILYAKFLSYTPIWSRILCGMTYNFIPWLTISFRTKWQCW